VNRRARAEFCCGCGAFPRETRASALRDRTPRPVDQILNGGRAFSTSVCTAPGRTVLARVERVLFMQSDFVSSLRATAIPPCAYSEEDSLNASFAMTRRFPTSLTRSPRAGRTPAPITRSRSPSPMRFYNVTKFPYEHSSLLWRRGFGPAAGFRAALSTAALLLAAGPQRDDRAVRLSIHEQGVLDDPWSIKPAFRKVRSGLSGHRRHSPASVTARRIEFRRPPTQIEIFLRLFSSSSA